MLAIQTISLFTKNIQKSKKKEKKNGLIKGGKGPIFLRQQENGNNQEHKGKYPYVQETKAHKGKKE